MAFESKSMFGGMEMAVLLAIALADPPTSKTVLLGPLQKSYQICFYSLIRANLIVLSESLW